MRQPAEQERLFNFGYAQGQEFIAALETGKIKREDLSSHAPVGALLLLEGPSGLHPRPDLRSCRGECSERCLSDRWGIQLRGHTGADCIQ